MPLVPILESKSQNGTQIFKSLKMAPFFVKTSHVCPVKSRLTRLEGVPRVSSSIFWIFLLFIFLFLNFFKKIKKLARVKLSSCYVAVTEWRSSDSDTCQYYARYHFLSLNLVSLF